MPVDVIEGLTTLDAERARSMADEGGAAAVVLECEPAPVDRPASRPWPLLVAGAVVGALVAYRLTRPA
jgi:hypothetical protein